MSLQSYIFPREMNPYCWKIGIEPLDIHNINLILENNALFISFLSKINNVLIGNTEDLDVVIPMYNMIEYKKTKKKTAGKPTELLNKQASWAYNFFKYKTGILGKTATNGNKKEVEFVAQIKNVSDF